MRINGDDVKLMLAMLFFSLFFLYEASAKPHMIAEVGKTSCLDKASSPKSLLKSLNVKVSTKKRNELIQVASVGETIARMTNEAHARWAMANLKVKYHQKLRPSSGGGCLPAHQLIRNEIHMARQCPSGYKIPYVHGIFVHELGHFVANKHGLYGVYKKLVTKRCKLSGYMHQNSAGKKHTKINEEFAEVFAAYLTYPRKLRKRCPKSFSFMKEKVFLGSKSPCL